MNNRSGKSEAGSSLVVVMCSMATLMVIAGVAVQYTTTINRSVQRTTLFQSALTAADSTIEQLFVNWRAISRATPSVPLATNSFSTIPLPSASQLNLPNVTNFAKAGTAPDLTDEFDPTYTVSNVKVVAVDATLQPMAGATAPPVPAVGMAQTGSMNTTSATYNYVASADVTLPTASGNVSAKVRRVFSKAQLSPWNYAIFYVDPLEIHPSPPFTVTGWVHTNYNLYTAHNTLTFADKVTYASDWFVNFMPGDNTHPETPASPNWLANLPPARDTALQPFGLDSGAIFSSSDTNPNNDSYRELIQPPVAGYTDPMTGSRYWDQASVIIQVNSANNVTIGTRSTPTPGVINALPATDPLYTMFSSAITTGQTIQDNRENASVRLITLDISKIENNTSGMSPTYKAAGFNGIVYIYDNSNTASTRRAVRLLNGTKIPSMGLTVVSQNAVYIQGNYNTGGNPPSNSGDPTTPQVSGYTRAPCAVIADAVNLLSNSWLDANSTAGTGSRVASNTTVNTAILGGIVPTSPVGGDGKYSGGAENFPRFLEDWSHATITYYGSMVELYQSGQSTGKWGSANVYVPPTRKWYFDTNFKTKPPPGSLMLYAYNKGRWYLQ
jgi:hypothetical protein